MIYHKADGREAAMDMKFNSTAEIRYCTNHSELHKFMGRPHPGSFGPVPVSMHGCFRVHFHQHKKKGEMLSICQQIK